MPTHTDFNQIDCSIYVLTVYQMCTSFNIPIHKPFLPKRYQWYFWHRLLQFLCHIRQQSNLWFSPLKSHKVHSMTLSQLQCQMTQTEHMWNCKYAGTMGVLIYRKMSILGPDIMPSNSVKEKLENRYVEYARRAMLHLLKIG